jgi:hypothetical protein
MSSPLLTLPNRPTDMVGVLAPPPDRGLLLHGVGCDSVTQRFQEAELTSVPSFIQAAPAPWDLKLYLHFLS